MSSPGDVLTLQEVASFLKVHPNTVYRLARKGAIPAFKVGTDWRFHRSSIEGWMRAQKTPEARPVLSDEVFHVTYWLLAQGFSLTVTSEQIGSVLDLSSRAVDREMRALVRLGYLSESDDGGSTRFALTAEGLQEARRRFLHERPIPRGHASVMAFASRQWSRI